MILILDFEFAAAHFYENKSWAVQKNKDVFGKCYTPHGHGHNYKLQLEIDVANAPLTKDLAQAKAEISSRVLPIIDKVDHSHLNFDHPYFKDRVPTTENISLYLKDQIDLPAPYRLKLLRLFEMDSIFVELTI